MPNANQQLQELLDEGEKRGFLSYDEILFALTDSNLPEEEIGNFYEMLQDKGITIVDDVADDEDDWELDWQAVEAEIPWEEPEFAPKNELAQIAAEPLMIHDAGTIAAAMDDKMTPLNLYLQEAAEITPLSIAEENELLRRAAAGEAMAAEKLLQHSQPLIMTVAGEFSGQGVAFLDLVQEGNMGLYSAIAKYDAEFDYRTQAVWWIRHYLSRYVKAEENIIRIPAKIAEDIKTLQKKEHHLRHELGRAATVEELAKELDWDNEQVIEIRQIIKHPDILEEYLAEESAESAPEAEEAEDDYWQEEEEPKQDLLHNMQKRSQKRSEQPKRGYYHK